MRIALLNWRFTHTKTVKTKNYPFLMWTLFLSTKLFYELFIALFSASSITWIYCTVGTCLQNWGRKKEGTQTKWDSVTISVFIAPSTFAFIHSQLARECLMPFFPYWFSHFCFSPLSLFPAAYFLTWMDALGCKSGRGWMNSKRREHQDECRFFGGTSVNIM